MFSHVKNGQKIAFDRRRAYTVYLRQNKGDLCVEHSTCSKVSALKSTQVKENTASAFLHPSSAHTFSGDRSALPSLGVPLWLHMLCMSTSV